MKPQMNFKALMLITVLTLAPTFGFAAGSGDGSGNSNGGGGAQIESFFRVRAYSLISKISLNSEANGFCDSSTLENALDNSEVRIVKQLSVDSESIKESKLDPSNLDAWTKKGDIQLLKSSWSEFFKANSLIDRNNRSLDALIIHEIYRATGSCQDNHFKITDRVYQLINGEQILRQKFSESYNFKYVYTLRIAIKSFLGDKHLMSFGIGICDAEIKAGTTLNCFIRGEAYGNENPNYRILKDIKIVSVVHHNDFIEIDTGSNTTEEVFPGRPSGDFNNQLQFISATHPFLVIHNIRNGEWSSSIQ